jgi:hypothetical protein
VVYRAEMDKQPDTWTAEGVKGGLIRFYHEIAGVGLVFPRADRPIAVEGVGMGLIVLRPIEGLEFVEETVIALGSSTELANAVSCRHIESRPLASLFRENTASPKCPTRIQDPDSCRSWPSKAFDRCRSKEFSRSCILSKSASS